MHAAAVLVCILVRSQHACLRFYGLTCLTTPAFQAKREAALAQEEKDEQRKKNNRQQRSIQAMVKNATQLATNRTRKEYEQQIAKMEKVGGA